MKQLSELIETAARQDAFEYRLESRSNQVYAWSDTYKVGVLFEYDEDLDEIFPLFTDQLEDEVEQDIYEDEILNWTDFFADLGMINKVLSVLGIENN